MANHQNREIGWRVVGPVGRQMSAAVWAIVPQRDIAAKQAGFAAIWATRPQAAQHGADGVTGGGGERRPIG